MLTTDKITSVEDLILDLTLFALKKECVKGEDAENEWNLATGLNYLLKLGVADPEDQTIEDKIDCLISLSPPVCQPIPVYVSSADCGMGVTLEVETVSSGNPCQGFEVTLNIF